MKLSPDAPFTWASGWKSPIYCDNRKTLSYPQTRELIRASFADQVQELYPGAEVIAGVATGGIAIGALVASTLGLPFVYVRSGQKKHGLGNQIEGVVPAGKQVVVIEDLVSTGKSSLQAVEALREAGAYVLGMLAIFSYNFDVAAQNMQQAGCAFHALTDYNTLLPVAETSGYIKPEQQAALKAWRSNPAAWGQ